MATQDYLSDKENLKTPEQKRPKPVDDGSRYVFPAGYPAPGSNFSPSVEEAPSLDDLNSTVENQVTLASQLDTRPSQASFVNPGASQSSRQPASPSVSMPSANPVGTFMEGANLEARTYDNMGRQEATAIQGVQDKISSIDAQMQEVQSQEEKLTQEFTKKDEETSNQIKNFQLKPKDFFAGKSTWQKVLGGIGMFLGSITPEGARNVASIIDKEIERDLDVQRNQLALLKDSRSEAAQRYKMKLEQFGSSKLARMSMKKDALEMVKLQVDQIASSAKGDLARSAALKGKAAIEQSQQTLQASMMKELLKANKDSAKGMLPGYEGVNENPSIVKDLTDRVAAKNSAFASINKLEGLLKDGALYGKNSELAAQTRKDLASAIAKAKFGKSSDSELAFASDLIPDVTSMMQRGSVDKALFKNLKEQINADVEAAAQAAGFRKALPAGAKVIQ